ncbi:MAG: type II secretion system protein N [Burkholderiales bacterium]|nr:type II secretion system protein N [Burkholderiales bacterium]
MAGAVAGTLAAVVLFAPAHWLAQALARASNGQVLLAETRGTVWNGSGRLLLAGGPGSTDLAALPGRVDWRLRPRLTGAILQVRAACCSPHPVRLDARWRLAGPALKVGAASLQVPAAVLTGLGTPWNTLQVDGDLALATQGLSVEWAEGRLAMTGQAELVARNVSSRLSTLRPMGSYRITVLGGAAPSLRLDTLDGPLRLAGSGQWVGQRLHFRGEAMAAPDREAALANLLNIIGRRSGGRSIITIG